MTENMQPNNDMAQLKALMQVIDEITAHKVPHYEMHELTSKSALRELQYVIDDCNALEDSDMIDTLNQTRIEIKYLASVVSDLRERLLEQDAQMDNMRADNQMLADRLRRAN